jgi:hypothetical protein
MRYGLEDNDDPPAWVEQVAPVAWSSPSASGTCATGKIRYGDRSDARASGIHARQHRKYRGTDDPDRFECGLYQCKRCDGWHVTSNPLVSDTVEYF